MTRAQIRNLEERSALWVAKHLVMAGRLLDIDPELAFQHALAASRRGGRLAAVREAVGLTAYGAGHYGEALREFRTFRRISGSNVHLPVMADCERGLGRPDRALDLARSEEAESLDAAGKAELAMVVSGARSDLGQLDAAVASLEIPQLDLHRAFSFSPRLFRAYAAALDAVGRTGESEKWRRQARVAEKALGLDDDLEPDIIDLGEDDEPAPGPVPKVAEVLGAPAAAPAQADAVAMDSDAPAVEDRADGEQLPLGVQTVVTLADDADDADDAVEDVPSLEDAVTAGEEESAVPAQPLQAETLFSMDDMGAAALAPSAAEGAESGESVGTAETSGGSKSDKDAQGSKAAKSGKGAKGTKDAKGSKSAKDVKDTKDTKDGKASKGTKDGKASKGTKDAKASKGTKVAEAGKAADAVAAPSTSVEFSAASDQSPSESPSGDTVDD
ncbi:hypothetical protein [Arthrobacter sp. TMS2-4]